ncbi:TPA: ABC transporter permease [Acinetobacter baumannii]
MSVVQRIAREEWRYLFRNRVAVFGLLLLFVLMLVATLNAWEHQNQTNAERAHYQAQANHEFETQPDRHPHRMVHYGHFVFRPLNPLAAFDPGIDAYTGNTLFLEGHRQNSANFGDVRQSSLLLRFGQLTPAFVLQVLAPLLLIFVGHSGVVRERESGTLRVLLAQGVSSRQLVMGKLLALTCFAGLIFLPALLALGWMAISGQTVWSYALLLSAGYIIWLLLWTLAIVLLSSLLTRSRDVLLALIAVWAVMVILLPRWIPDVVNTAIELPSRMENEINAQREYRALGDAHNPNDPKFIAFREQVLKQYGVTRIEDLPVNFKGLVGMEGERQSTELFNRYATVTLDLQAQQNQMVDRFGWLSPTLALRRLSMTASGTDLDNFRRFLEQGEHYRYDLIQGLNRLQVEELTYADDTNKDKENRIDHKHWQAFPPFQFKPRTTAETWQQIVPAGGILLLWLVILSIATWFQASRLGRIVR